MGKVTVYRVQRYDIGSDGYKQSNRFMTEAGARMICAQIIPGSAIEIDETDLEPTEQWTAIGYTPKRPGDGTQKQVLP